MHIERRHTHRHTRHTQKEKCADELGNTQTDTQWGHVGKPAHTHRHTYRHRDPHAGTNARADRHIDAQKEPPGTGGECGSRRERDMKEKQVQSQGHDTTSGTDEETKKQRKKERTASETTTSN